MVIKSEMSDNSHCLLCCYSRHSDCSALLSTHLLANDLLVRTILTEQKEYMPQADNTLAKAAFSAASWAAAADVGVSGGGGSWWTKGAISTSFILPVPAASLRTGVVDDAIVLVRVGFMFLNVQYRVEYRKWIFKVMIIFLVYQKMILVCNASWSYAGDEATKELKLKVTEGHSSNRTVSIVSINIPEYSYTTGIKDIRRHARYIALMENEADVDIPCTHIYIHNYSWASYL